MAKYSTGGVGSGDSGSCELCGAEGRSLKRERVAGAALEICGECRERHGDGGTRDRSGGGRGRGGQGGGGQGDGEESRKLKAVRAQARMHDARKGDASRWEQGTDYEDDPLPYLTRGYGDIVEAARQDAGLQTDELAAELGVDEADVIAVEQGRANSAGIGGSLITELEERLNVELVEGE